MQMIQLDPISETALSNTRDIGAESQASRSIAEIQSSLVMARKFPRSEEVCFSKISKSLDRLSFSEKATYSFKRSAQIIEGPSAPLSRELARTWGNMWHGITVIHDDDETRTVQGWSWDLETNTRVSSESSFKKLVQRAKFDSNGKKKW